MEADQLQRALMQTTLEQNWLTIFTGSLEMSWIICDSQLQLSPP